MLGAPTHSATRHSAGDLVCNFVSGAYPRSRGGTQSLELDLPRFRVVHVPSHASQHHFQRIVEPFENFA